jgi:hypothetical protein
LTKGVRPRFQQASQGEDGTGAGSAKGATAQSALLRRREGPMNRRFGKSRKETCPGGRKLPFIP